LFSRPYWLDRRSDASEEFERTKRAGYCIS
jgi:hypothetical protein